jgi:glycosyltransferase involved in cell wall biosynthesis
MTRVFYLASDLGPNAVAKQLALVAPRLPPDAVATAVGVLGEPEPFAGHLAATGVEVVRLPIRHSIDVPGAMTLARAVAAYNPDVLHAWGAFAARAARVLGLSGRFTHVRPRVLVTTRADLRPCVAAAPPPPDPADLRRSLDIPESGRLILAAGRFDNTAGLRHAIWAFDVLKFAIPDVYLVLAGDGPDRGRTARFSSALASGDHRVRFAGTRPDLAALMGLAEVAWVTHTRGGTNIALEAMAAGVPVVALANPDIARVIEDGATGRMVPAGDRIRLAAVTNDLIDKPADRLRLGSAGQAAAQTRFAVGPVVDHYVQSYHDLNPTGH